MKFNFISKTINFSYFYALTLIRSRQRLNKNNNTERLCQKLRTELQKSKIEKTKKILNCSSLKMMPHHGRNFEEEMSRFEAEINNARAAAFMAAGGGMAQVPMIAVTSASAPNFSQSSIINRNRPVQISAPPSGAPMMRAPPSSAVISAPPSNAVISAKPTLRTKDDDDILATLMKVEKEIKSEPKPVSYPEFI